MNANNRDRHQLFKNLKILPLKSQHIFFLFIICCQKWRFIWIKFRNS